MHEFISIEADSGAPILPGVGAAGLQLGDRVKDFATDDGVPFRVESMTNHYARGESCLLRSDDMVIATERGKIIQILICGEYRGAVLDRVRLGDTVRSAAAALGSVGEDDEDNLVFANMPGLAVEIASTPFVGAGMTSYSPEWVNCILESRIIEISVFPPTCDCGSDLRNRRDTEHCPGCGRIIFEPIEP